MLQLALSVTFAASAAIALASLIQSARELAAQWPAIRRALLSLEL